MIETLLAPFRTMSALTQRASLALLPLIAAAPAAIQAPAYAPKDGSTLVKSFVLTMNTAIDDSTTLVNGDDSQSPSIESETLIVRKLQVSDHIVSCESGRPTKLVRSYDGLGINIESPLQMSGPVSVEADLAFEGVSPLDALEVEFTWDSDAETYKRAWVGGEGDSSHLDGLAEDLDLRALLPDGEVSVGDSWAVDPEAFVDLLYSGGDLSFEMSSTGDSPPAGVGNIEDQPSPRESFDKLGDCKVTARLAEPRSDGGRRLAVISFTADLEGSLDNSEAVLKTLGEMVPGGTFNVELANTDTFVEGKGEMLWDMAAGHAASLTFEGELTASQEQRASLSFGGQELDIESTTNTSGTVELKVEISAK